MTIKLNESQIKTFTLDLSQVSESCSDELKEAIKKFESPKPDQKISAEDLLEIEKEIIENY